MFNPVTYAISLAQRNTDTIGFLPRLRYELAQEAGQLQVQLYNGEPCGFLIHGPIRYRTPVTIWQCAIQIDARRIGSATALVNDLIARATSRESPKIRLAVRHDNDANLFWQSLRFIPIATSPAGKARGGHLIHYVRELATRDRLLFTP